MAKDIGSKTNAYENPGAVILQLPYAPRFYERKGTPLSLKKYLYKALVDTLLKFDAFQLIELHLG